MRTIINFKSDRVLVFIIIAAALFLRILYLADYKESAVFLVSEHSDGNSYLSWGKDIASLDIWGGKAFMKWPLYAFFLGFIFKCFGENIALVYLIQFILGSISCALVYLITKRIFGRACAFIAAMLCVWYAPFIFYEGLLDYICFSLFLNLLFFYLLLCIQKRLNGRVLFLAGIFLGVCVLTQGNILIFGVLSVGWLLWMERLKFRVFLNKFIIFIFGLSLVIGAVTLRNYMVERDFVLLQGNLGVNFFIGNNPEATGLFFSPVFFKSNQEGIFRDSRIIAEAETGKVLKSSQVSGFWFKRSLEFIKRNPLAYAKLLGKKAVYLFSPREFIHDIDYHWLQDKPRVANFLFPDLRFILPLCLLGLFLNLSNFKKTALLYFAFIALSFNVILFFVATRYRVALVPFMAIFASSALLSLWDSAVKRKIKNTLMLLLALGLLCAYVAFIGKKNHFAGQFVSVTYPPSLNEAVGYIDKGDYNGAIKKLGEIQPPNHYSVFCFGVIAYNMKDLAAAEKRFKESINMNRYFVDSYYNLGIIYSEQKRFSEAGYILEKAVALDPDNYSYHFALAEAYKGIGELKRAKNEFGLALKKINRWRTNEKEAIEKEILLLATPP